MLLFGRLTYFHGNFKTFAGRQNSLQILKIEQRTIHYDSIARNATFNFIVCSAPWSRTTFYAPPVLQTIYENMIRKSLYGAAAATAKVLDLTLITADLKLLGLREITTLANR